MKVYQMESDKKWVVGKAVPGRPDKVTAQSERFDTKTEAKEELLVRRMQHHYWKAEDLMNKLRKLDPAKYENSTVGEQCN